MSILAIDTSLGACSVAVNNVSETATMSRGYADALLPMVERVMGEAGTTYLELDAILVTLGPGSFTGLRVGISAAKAFGVALDIPILGITTFRALSFFIEEPKPTLCVLESKREALFVQSFYHERYKEPTMAKPGDIDKCGMKVIGDGAHHLNVQTNLLYPSPKLMIDAYEEDSEIFENSVKAFYIRDADVSVSKHVQRRLAKI